MEQVASPGPRPLPRLSARRRAPALRRLDWFFRPQALEESLPPTQTEEGWKRQAAWNSDLVRSPRAQARLRGAPREALGRSLSGTRMWRERRRGDPKHP